MLMFERLKAVNFKNYSDLLKYKPYKKLVIIGIIGCGLTTISLIVLINVNQKSLHATTVNDFIVNWLARYYSSSQNVRETSLGYWIYDLASQILMNTKNTIDASQLVGTAALINAAIISFYNTIFNIQTTNIDGEKIHEKFLYRYLFKHAFYLRVCIFFLICLSLFLLTIGNHISAAICSIVCFLCLILLVIIVNECEPSAIKKNSETSLLLLRKENKISWSNKICSLLDNINMKDDNNQSSIENITSFMTQITHDVIELLEERMINPTQHINEDTNSQEEIMDKISQVLRDLDESSLSRILTVSRSCQDKCIEENKNGQSIVNDVYYLIDKMLIDAVTITDNMKISKERIYKVFQKYLKADGSQEYQKMVCKFRESLGVVKKSAFAGLENI
jgi:hypothetical protein